jgi:hypothetical protein
MRERSSRRRYLQVLGVAGTTGLAGCSSPFGDSPNGTDEPLQTAESLPEWTGWVPAEPVTSGEQELVGADFEGVRKLFPELADGDWGLDEYAADTGVETEDISYVIGLSNGSDWEATILTGSFDAETIRSNNDFWWFQTDSYQGYTTVDAGIAFGDGVSITGEYEPVLDRRVGETPPIGENDTEWRTLLSTLTGRTLVYATESSLSSSELLDFARTGVSYERVDGTTEATRVFMFDSESEATDVYENRKGRLSAAATGEGGTVQDIRLAGTQVIVTIRGNDITF